MSASTKIIIITAALALRPKNLSRIKYRQMPNNPPRVLLIKSVISLRPIAAANWIISKHKLIAKIVSVFFQNGSLGFSAPINKQNGTNAKKLS
ncbi:hypothetical protein AGMMS50284_4530 [Clostridia bacterium]|nr:hypothetical protein AGMMS50284_4530 [Clostridia bacterium]